MKEKLFPVFAVNILKNVLESAWSHVYIGSKDHLQVDPV